MLHVVHFAMALLGKPVKQMALVFRQLHAGDAGLLETKFARPGAYVSGEALEIRRVH